MASPAGQVFDDDSSPAPADPAPADPVPADPHWVCEICDTDNAMEREFPAWSVLLEICSNCEQPPPEETRQRFEDKKQKRREKLVLQAPAVVQQVTDAFQGVRLGRGLSLHEAVAADWCWPPGPCPMSGNDERDDWTRIPRQAEKQAETGTCKCGCAPGSTRFQRTQGTCYPFSFFEAEGFRFHLPAYLVAGVGEAVQQGSLERAEEVTEFVLTGDSRGRHDLLNRQQCQAVAACFAWFLQMGVLCGEPGGVSNKSQEELVQCHEYWATKGEEA